MGATNMPSYDDNRKAGKGLNLPRIETVGADVSDLIVRSGARSSLSRYSTQDYHGEVITSPKRIEGKPPKETKKAKKSKASVEAEALLKFGLGGNKVKESELTLQERDALLALKGVAIRRVVLNGERWIVHLKG
jgi:hypothetical protein